MPNFEFNTENAVLVKIFEGKSYISHPGEYVTQEPQKEGTCWYYALNYLRPRYKMIDKLVSVVSDCKELKELQNDVDYLALKKAREVEKTISAYRKKLTMLNRAEQKSRDFEQKSAENKSAENKRKERVQLARELVTKLHGSEYTSQFEKLVNEAIDFSRQVHKAFPLEDSKFSDTAAKLEEAKIINLTILACGGAYGLKVSGWKVEHGFDGLMNGLKQHGALVMRGCFGLSYCKALPCRSEHKYGSFSVYYWQPDDHVDEAGSDAHEILVIGAEKTKNDEYIYYIDPNDRLSASCERRVYKMSYARFEWALFDLYGFTGLIRFFQILLEIVQRSGLEVAPHHIEASMKHNSDAAVYAFAANEKLQIESVQQYKQVMGRIKHISPTLYEKHFHPKQKEMKGVGHIVSDQGLFSVSGKVAPVKPTQKISTDYTLLIDEQKDEKNGLLHTLCGYLKCC